MIQGPVCRAGRTGRNPRVLLPGQVMTRTGLRISKRTVRISNMSQHLIEERTECSLRFMKKLVSTSSSRFPEAVTLRGVTAIISASNSILVFRFRPAKTLLP